MASTFFARTEALKERVGTGLMSFTVSADQVYAYNIEAGGWENFLGKYGPRSLEPRHGGELHALELSLKALADHLWEDCADRLLLPDGLFEAFVSGAEELCAAYSLNAPVEWGNLRLSGHPVVEDNGATVYDRPPISPRLSRAELDAQDAASDRPDWTTPSGTR
jgi:hypothetical protein